MNSIARRRTIAAAGFLAASTLLGTALAAGPAMQNQGHAAMQRDSRTAMQQDASLAMEHEVTPGPWDTATLTAMTHDARPAGMPSE